MTKETTNNLLECMKLLYGAADVIKDAANREPSDTGQEERLLKIREHLKKAADDLKDLVLYHGRFEKEED